MKQNLHHCALLFLLLFLLSSSQTSARFIATKQGELNEVTADSSIAEMEGNYSLNGHLMGLDNCDNGDEECLKRRIVAEAHLDYIYTQQSAP